MTIPNTVTNIGKNAFYYCTNLVNVAISGSVTSIGEKAFLGCGNLVDVVISNGVTAIGNEAFCRCARLVNVTIPDSVTSFGNNCFGYIRHLGDVNSEYSKSYLCPAYRDGLYRAALQAKGSANMATVDSRYNLANTPGDRTIAAINISSDSAIDDFVLVDGKVFDTVLYVSNTAQREVHVSLPAGYTYKTFKGTAPLTLPANTSNILTITRIADSTFLVSREELETVK